jgi:glutamine---fructose-6-phosphate transaminase (isomerizing)
MTTQLEREIREQAEALSGRRALGDEQAAPAAALLRRDDVDYLMIAARGSSDNAARYAQYLLGSGARLTVALAAPWLFGAGHRPPRLHGAAVMGISQSGRSPDVVAVLAAARAQGRPAIALTNDPASPLAEVADVVVELGVGAERSVAATKTYLASLHALAQIAHRLAPLPGWDEMTARLPGLVAATTNAQLASRERFDVLAQSGRLTAVGRGLDFSAACEAALKLRELSGIAAEAFSPPDLAHGPIAALDPKGGLWVSAAADVDQRALELLTALRRRSGRTVAVSADDRLLALADVPVPLPADLPGWAAAMLAVIPAQAAALRLAERAGVAVDSPHGLSKITLTS